MKRVNGGSYSGLIPLRTRRHNIGIQNISSTDHLDSCVAYRNIEYAWKDKGMLQVTSYCLPIQVVQGCENTGPVFCGYTTVPDPCFIFDNHLLYIKLFSVVKISLNHLCEGILKNRTTENQHRTGGGVRLDLGLRFAGTKPEKQAPELYLKQ